MERKWKESGRRKRRRRKKEEFSPLQGGNKTLSFKSKTKITNLNRAQNSHGRVALVPRQGPRVAGSVVSGNSWPLRADCIGNSRAQYRGRKKIADLFFFFFFFAVAVRRRLSQPRRRLSELLSRPRRRLSLSQPRPRRELSQPRPRALQRLSLSQSQPRTRAFQSLSRARTRLWSQPRLLVSTSTWRPLSTSTASSSMALSRPPPRAL